LPKREFTTKTRHFELPLPLEDGISLPNNRNLALKTLTGLKKKLTADQNYREQCVTFISELINNGNAEKVPVHDIDAEGNK